MQQQLPELIKSLNDKFELQIDGTLSRESIINILEQKVSRLIEKNPEEFFQLMYRIDISEKQLNRVLREADAINGLANLIYDRQLEKAESRIKYRSYFERNSADDELMW